ncbi:MAG: methyltransferase domain-containing protein [Acidobacteria bacterium]|nr:methyltransferase domain-containing protein [Acidobacteriota bacterium]
MLRTIVRQLKKFPLDFGQYELRYTTKGKLIAYQLVGEGAKKTALDVGCRDGYWSERLKEKHYAVDSCDIEPHYAGATQVDVNLKLPFAESSLDLIWCTEVIEHLLNPAFTVSEFKRILKPGGQLVMTTPNQGFWVFRIIERLGIPMATLENEDHHSFFTYATMGDLVGKCNFFGYFPYLLMKFHIRAAAPLLSPTIVLSHLNDKATGQVVPVA